MKPRDLLTASGVALAAFLMVQPATAQNNSMPAASSGHVDASGTPADHSTPQEQAETARLNTQVTLSNAEIAAQDNNNKAKFQIEQRQYQEQLQQNATRQQEYRKQKAVYEDRMAHYEALQARYAAQRTAHHRDAGTEE